MDKFISVILNGKKVEATPVVQMSPAAEFDLPIASMIITTSIFICAALVAYFALMRKEQKKLDSDTFLFSVEDEKNLYSEKIKFLNKQEVAASKV